MFMIIFAIKKVPKKLSLAHAKSNYLDPTNFFRTFAYLFIYAKKFFDRSVLVPHYKKSSFHE